MINRRQFGSMLACAPLIGIGSRVGAAIGPTGTPVPVKLAPDVELPASIFAAYALNRKVGRANLITESFLVHAIELSRRRAQIGHERKVLAPALALWIEGLAVAAANATSSDLVRDFIAVLLALSKGVPPPADRPKAIAEVAAIKAADAIGASAVTALPLDFTQFKVRGHYAGDVALERYFQSYRYAAALAFLLVPAKATGVSVQRARLLGDAAVALSRLATSPAVRPLTERLFGLIEQSFGAAEDFGPLDLPAAIADPAVRDHWIANAAVLGRVPSVVDVLYDSRKLRGKDPSAIAISWRLLPGRRLADVAALQRLTYPSTGVWQGTSAELPFDAGQIGPRTAKAYVTLDDIFALTSATSGDVPPFDGLQNALIAQRAALLHPTDASAPVVRLLRAGNSEAQPGAFRQQALAAAYVHYRHGMALVAKQSYAPADKSFRLPQPRAGAVLASTPDFIRTLASYVNAQSRRFDDPAWRDWLAVLDHLEDIAYVQARGQIGDMKSDNMLNDLDLRLRELVDPDHDHPIVTDIHSAPAEGKVVEIGLGSPVAVAAGNAVGAILPVCQFKHPMADRMSDDQWATALTTQPLNAFLWKPL